MGERLKHHLRYCPFFLKFRVSLEAIILTFVHKINKRTKLVPLSIKMKKCLGLKSKSEERKNFTACICKGEELISTLIVYIVILRYLNPCGGSPSFLCSTMSFHVSRVGRGPAAFRDGYNSPVAISSQISVSSP